MNMAVIGRLILPKRVHIFMFTNLRIGDLSWQRDFTDVMKVRILQRRDILNYPDGPNVVIMALLRDKQEGQSQRRRCDDEAELEVMWS